MIENRLNSTWKSKLWFRKEWDFSYFWFSDWTSVQEICVALIIWMSRFAGFFYLGIGRSGPPLQTALIGSSASPVSSVSIGFVVQDTVWDCSERLWHLNCLSSIFWFRYEKFLSPSMKPLVLIFAAQKLSIWTDIFYYSFQTFWSCVSMFLLQ